MCQRGGGGVVYCSRRMGVLLVVTACKPVHHVLPKTTPDPLPQSGLGNLPTAPAPKKEDPPPPPKPKMLECGEASYYAFEFQGAPTANGEIFDTYALTAAHKTLPFGTRLHVFIKGQEPGGSSAGVSVRINDRGPFIPGRIIDLSLAAFEKLTPKSRGTVDVCLFEDSVLANSSASPNP